MNCQDISDAIVESGRRTALDPETRLAVEAHVAACAACRARLTRERQLTDGLRRLAASIGEAPPAVAAQLLQAFDELHAAPAKRQSAAFSPFLAWMRIAAAAGVILVGGAALWLGIARSGKTSNTANQPAPASPPSAAAKPSPALNGPGTPTTATADLRPASTGNDATATKSGRRPHRGRGVQAEGFMPLPTAIGLPPFESGSIVRVEIPLASLPDFGIEVSPDAHDMPIQADFLVGQDGQARGIRLVTTTAKDSRSRE